MEATAYPVDVERVLGLKSIRDSSSRALFLAAIREFGKEGAEFSIDRLGRLTAVEEHFQTLLLYDQLEFLRQPSAVSEEQRDFALNIQRICLEAANGFQRFLRHRTQWAKSREAVDLMFGVTGLALNAIHCFVKWSYFLNEPGKSAPWKQMHALYALGEADGYAQVPFVLHPSQPSFKPSVQSLYLRTLILDMLNTGTLTKIQIEIADGWFSSWCGDYALDTLYSSRSHLFYVDLASDSGLHLMRKDSHGDSMRYVRAQGMKAQIEEVQAGLRHGKLYAGYGAGAVFPVEEHVALLAIIEKLYHSILAGSENRIEERTHFEDREIDVVPGADRVFGKIRAGPMRPVASVPAAVAADSIEISPSGLSLTPIAASPSVAPEPGVQSWRVFDMSSKGYGLLVDRSAAEEVLLNGLIAIRNQETGGWIVGNVVRKLSNRVRGEILAGVEVLAFHPIRVELHPADMGLAIEALYLPGLDSNGKLDAILLRVADFSSDRTFLLNAGETRFRIRLNRIIKKGADWIKARFEIDEAP